MKPQRDTAFAGAVPFERGPGHRTPATLLLLDERDKLLVAAAQHFPGASDREIARQLRIALVRYRECRWRRERSEARCPLEHRGRLTEVLWLLLKVRDFVPSERLIRLVLAKST